MALRFEFSKVGSTESGYVDDAWLMGGPTTTTTTAPATPSAPAFAYRISAGTFNEVVVDGNTFLADRDYLGGSTAGPMSYEIADTADDDLYRKHRWGMAGYTVSVPVPGPYRVRLHFAEVVFQAAGYRIFDVLAEGGLVVDDLDVARRVGANRALVEEFTVSVDDALDLRFNAVVEDPMVSGIEVISESGSATTPAPATTTTTAAPTTTTTAPPAATTTTTAPPTTTTTAPPTTTTTAPPATTTTTPPLPSSSHPDASTTGVPAGTVL
ncbi:MAG: malectin domain-containing carbohydrate-binding protein, partial [Acidimicrobiales bacterium]